MKEYTYVSEHAKGYRTGPFEVHLNNYTGGGVPSGNCTRDGRRIRARFQEGSEWGGGSGGGVVRGNCNAHGTSWRHS